MIGRMRDDADEVFLLTHPQSAAHAAPTMIHREFTSLCDRPNDGTQPRRADDSSLPANSWQSTGAPLRWLQWHRQPSLLCASLKSFSQVSANLLGCAVCGNTHRQIWHVHKCSALTTRRQDRNLLRLLGH